jgi:hypothetical protein
VNDDSVTIGPYTFAYIADGDDPGTGWLRVSADEFRVCDDMQTDRDEFDRFTQAASGD